MPKLALHGPFPSTLWLSRLSLQHSERYNTLGYPTETQKCRLDGMLGSYRDDPLMAVPLRYTLAVEH